MSRQVSSRPHVGIVQVHVADQPLLMEFALISPVRSIGRVAVKLVGAKSRAFLATLAAAPIGSVEIFASLSDD